MSVICQCESCSHAVLCQTVSGLEEQNNYLKQALEYIKSIPNKLDGGDWDEIEEARAVATKALEAVQ